jgi:GT2 family glycosyltransferase
LSRATPGTPQQQSYRVSVAVSTYERPDRVARLLEALGRQSIPATDFEVVMYDDGSSAASLETVRTLAAAAPFPLRLIEGGVNRGPATGRNHAWQATTAPIVAFTDDDCVPTPDWLSHALRAFDDPAVEVAVGRIEPAVDQLHLLGPFSRTMHATDARFFATANCLYRREALTSADGFDERFRRAAGEDTDLGLRVLERGGQAAFVNDALVHHDVRPSSLRAAAREAWAKWIDLALVVRKHPRVRRELMYRRVFWKKPHALLLLAVAGSIAAAWEPLTLIAWVPYLWHRLRSAPLSHGWVGPVLTLPGALLIDAIEIVTMVRSTLRYRTFVL